MSLYDDLGLAPDADADAIKAAYRAKAKQLHPDNAETGDRDRFERVARAYMVLHDPQSRARYDATGETGDDAHSAVPPVAAIIVQHFQRVVQERSDHSRTDLIAATVRSMESLIDDQKRMILEGKAQLKRIDNVLDRLTPPEGMPDFIGNSIRSDRALIESGIADAEVNIDRHGEAIRVVKGYSYRCDKKAKQAAFVVPEFKIDWAGAR